MTVSVSNQIYTICIIKFQKLCLEFLIESPSTNSAQFSHNYFSHQTKGFNPWPDSEPD